ncbi:MAG: DNA repair protein RecO [Nitrospirae bacterium]|nr:DNA repair protein RecO [Candidatus Manganitrophaceae bacterium]
MSLLTTPAIVLGSIKLGEADKLVTFFTAKKGKLKGVAKGARRMKSRFGAALEPFTHCNLVVFEKPGDKLARINQSDIVHSFQLLRENWSEIHLASHMVQMVQKLTPDEEPNPAIFRLLLEALTYLEKGADRQLSAILFVIRLVAYSGYQPRLDQCLKCRKRLTEPKIYFSPGQGGTVCPPCAERMERLASISQGTLAFLRGSQRMDYAAAHRIKLTAAMRSEIEVLFGDHITYITGAPSPKFVPEPVHS